MSRHSQVWLASLALLLVAATLTSFTRAQEAPFPGHPPLPERSQEGRPAPLTPGASQVEPPSLSVHCFVLLSLRDDAIHVDLALRILNLGQRPWFPAGYRVALPTGRRAFSVLDPSATPRFVEVPGGAELVGAIPPGEHEAALAFTLPNPARRFWPWTQRDSVTIELLSPPHVVGASIWIDRVPGLRGAVDGFGDPRLAWARDGNPGLLIESTTAGAAGVPPVMPIRLEGLPRRGAAPFFTVLGSLVLLAWGVAGFSRPRSASRPEPVDVERARGRILAEISALERALGAGLIGPQTHGTARRALVEALARLEEPTVATGRGKPRSGGRRGLR